MLRDITIGQHFPGNSVLHRCDPRLKLVATIAYIVVLFVAPNPLGLALSIALLAALYKVAKIPGKLILKSLKPIVPIVLFTAVLNLFFVTGEGEPLVHIWVLKIYGEGIRYAILLTVRVCALIAGTSLLTYTTSPIWRSLRKICVTCGTESPSSSSSCAWPNTFSTVSYIANLAWLITSTRLAYLAISSIEWLTSSTVMPVFSW